MNKNLLGAIILLLLLGLSFGSLSAQALTGIKQIGPGGDYTTFTAAINALNINGVGAGGVTFYVEAGATFAERPPAITATGTETDPIIFQKSGSGNNPVIRPTGTSSNNEAGIIISGGDYITFDGIDINASAVTNVEYGYLIRNASATNGAKHNTIKNMTVTMNRASTGYIYSAGIMQSTDATVGAGVTPTAQSGANDYNRYLNFSLQSSACGILMFGGDFNDQYCEITTTSDTIRNTLNNLGSTSSNMSYGIYILKGSNFTVHNSDVSSITSTSDIVGGMYLSTVFTGTYNKSVVVLVESNYGTYSYLSPAAFAGSYLYSQDYQFGGVGNSNPQNPTYMGKDDRRPYVRFWVTSQGYYEDAVTEQSSTATLSANSTNQQIIRTNVMTGGSQSPQTINSLTFNTNGTTDVSDIVAARIYYTGSSSTFSTTTQYGSTITNFGAKGSFTVSQNLSVSSGNHYFWLVYDVGANLNIGDHFDAQCTSVSVNNISRTPSITDPAGYRSVAGKKMGGIEVYQFSQGTTSSGAQNLGILEIYLNVIEGSDSQSFASLKINSMAITGKNTNNADVSAVKLADQTNPSSFLGSVSMATGTANFNSLNYELALGMNTLYVYYDLSSDAGAGNTVDAKIIANSINVSGITHPSTEWDPNGEYTIENFNYGGGYAQQGGYYFANTLATPAPSHPTFDWIDISATGTNAYPELTNDDGYAPNNASGYPIGFNFPYFGNTFTSFWIGADGSIYLSRPTLPLPMGQQPSNVIALFATDFFPESANYPKTILYKNVDGKLVVTYLKAQPKPGASASSYATFQVVLFPTGKFKIQLLEFGPSFPTNNGAVYIINSNATAFHAYAYGGMAGPVSGSSPIAVAYGQNAYMLGDTPAQNDLPVAVSGTATASFPITGATVQFTTATAATNLTAIRVDTNPLGTLPVGILSLANRHWTINSTATSGLGNYSLTLNLTGLPNVGGANLFYLVKRSHVSSAWENLGLPVSFDSNTKLATWAISNGFSDFGIGFEEEFTLPVELSSFTAVLTAQNYVKLNWTTQSETALNGYYVYRAMSSQLNTAQLVSPLIGATNSSSQQHYEYTDQELYDEGTYYYWLQSSELDGSSQFFGPVTVFFGTEAEIPLPEIPTITALNRIYPNPFNPLAHISYTLKESVPVDLKIYNKRGQLVRSFSNPPNQTGLHRVLWDGNDNDGRPCSSGVYLFRMTAGKEVFTQKAILLK